MAVVGPQLTNQLCTLKHSLEGHTAGVLAITFTKNGRYVMTASQDKSIRLWNPHSGVHVKTYQGPHNHGVNDLVVTDDNSKFISCGGDKHFFQWDVTTGQVVRKFSGHDRKVNSLAFGPGQDVVISGSTDKSVRIWDLRTRGRGHIQVLDDASDSILCVSVSGDEIVSGSTDGGVRRYDVRKGLFIVDQLLQPIGSISFSNDRECMLVSTLDHKIRLLDRETGNELACYTGHTNKDFKVQSTLDPTDAYVISGSEDHKVCIWDLAEAGNVASSLAGHGGPVLCMRFCGDILATAAADGSVHIWHSNLKSLQSSLPKRSTGKALAGVRQAAPEGLPTSFGKQAGARQRKGPAAIPLAVCAPELQATYTFRPAQESASPALAVCASSEPAAGEGETQGGQAGEGTGEAIQIKKRGDRGKRKGKRKLGDD